MNGEKGVLLQSRVINPMLLFYLFDRIEELYAKSEYHRRFITELHTIIDRLIGWSILTSNINGQRKRRPIISHSYLAINHHKTASDPAQLQVHHCACFEKSYEAERYHNK